MSRAFSVLITSAGRRVGLIECFRRAAAALDIDLAVVAADVDPDLSAACSVADRAVRVPACGDPGYVEAVARLAEQHGVRLVVPTIDPELAPLAAAHARFTAVGARLLVADPETIRLVRDKSETMRVLAAAGVAVPRSALLSEARCEPDAWRGPLVAKPRDGSASAGLRLVDGLEQLGDETGERTLVQQRLNGPEYTVNVFVARDGTLRCVVPHRRLRIRAGEVEKGRTERHPYMPALAAGIRRALPGLAGVFCFQAIADPVNGTRVFEINARFGGGYPLADRAGAPFARWLLEETLGVATTTRDDWREGVLMLRYDAAVYHG